jgi:N-acetyl sugar amidotransferase
MDTTASDIVFDDKGVCNYCTEFIERSKHIIFESSENKQKRLISLVERVKEQGKGKQYDCIVGVSGGVDSSWTLVQVKKLGLRPLAVHMDNGWNSELAQNNIANLVQGLGVDLYTHVIDWEEYRALMQSFFDSDVLDVELLYDNAMSAVNFRQANQYGLKHILSGSNQVTEGMKFPEGWNWLKLDKKNIKAIGRTGGVKRLDTFPAIGLFEFIWYAAVKKIRWVSFLDYIDFDKEKALLALEKDYGYKRYPYKHYESVFTRFYQGYLLPTKFNVDKRKLHLSTLIASGQLSREEAIQSLKGIPYPSQQDLQQDISYFLKKMNWTQADLDIYLKRPQRSHLEFASERPLWQQLKRFYRRFD